MKILVISDIHGNPSALKAVLKKHGKVDEIWAIGDYIGFCPDPEGVVAILKKLPNLVAAVKGNWEHLYLSNFDVTKAPGAPGNATKEDLVKVVTDGMSRVTGEVKEYIASLPDSKIVEKGGKKFHLAHCAAYDPFDGSVESNEGLEKSIKASDADVFINGDMHIQKKIEYKGRLFLNPGAVSWPSSGKMGAQCMILEVNGSLKVKFDNVPYDYKKVYKELEKINLPRRHNFLKAKPLWD